MLHDWFGDAATEEDRAILEHSNDGAGAIVEGRTSFEKRGRRRLGKRRARGGRPLLHRGGTPLFGTLGTAILLERTQVVITPAAPT